jgi:hypothetical protein
LYNLVLAILCIFTLAEVMAGGSCAAPSEENTFVELLKLLPAEAKEGRVITLIDYKLFRQANGIQIYDNDGQRIDRDEYINILIDIIWDDSFFGDDIFRFSSYWTSMGNNLDRSSIKEENIGYEVTDIDAEINNIFSLYSPEIILSGGDAFKVNEDMMIAAFGEFNQQAISNALENRDDWPEWAIENYSGEKYENTIIHSWGDSLECHVRDRLSPPHLDFLGRAMPLAISNGYLFVGSSEENIRSMVDTSLDEKDSLADIPEYKLAAQGMDDLGAVIAIIMDETHVSDNMRSTISLIRPRITNYVTISMGPGKDETGVYMALVIVHANNADAEDNVSSLEQKIEEYNTFCKKVARSPENSIYNTEIYTKGKVLLAKLYTANESIWRYWFFNQWEMVTALE